MLDIFMDGRQLKRAGFEPLVPNRQTVFIPPEQLDSVTAAIALFENRDIRQKQQEGDTD